MILTAPGKCLIAWDMGRGPTFAVDPLGKSIGEKFLGECEVWRAQDPENLGGAAVCIGETRSEAFLDTSAQDGAVYYYWVMERVPSGGLRQVGPMFDVEMPYAWEYPMDIAPTPPESLIAESARDGILLSWVISVDGDDEDQPGRSGIVAYFVYDSNQDAPDSVVWVDEDHIGDVFTDELPSGTEKSYQIRALNENLNLSEPSEIVTGKAGAGCMIDLFVSYATPLAATSQAPTVELREFADGAWTTVRGPDVVTVVFNELLDVTDAAEWDALEPGSYRLLVTWPALTTYPHAAYQYELAALTNTYSFDVAEEQARERIDTWRAHSRRHGFLIAPMYLNAASFPIDSVITDSDQLETLQTLWDEAFPYSPKPESAVYRALWGENAKISPYDEDPPGAGDPFDGFYTGTLRLGRPYSGNVWSYLSKITAHRPSYVGQPATEVYGWYTVAECSAIDVPPGTYWPFYVQAETVEWRRNPDGVTGYWPMSPFYATPTNLQRIVRSDDGIAYMHTWVNYPSHPRTPDPAQW